MPTLVLEVAVLSLLRLERKEVAAVYLV